MKRVKHYRLHPFDVAEEAKKKKKRKSVYGQRILRRVKFLTLQ